MNINNDTDSKYPVDPELKSNRYEFHRSWLKPTGTRTHDLSHSVSAR
jgi:hypothetical protein